MIIVDRELHRRADAGDPVRVALVGCGVMGQAIARQVVLYTPGIELCAIVNRTESTAAETLRTLGCEPVSADSEASLAGALDRGQPAVTADPRLVTRCERFDAIIEATGTVEYGASVVLDALENGRHVLLSNAELDGTIGPVLKTIADDNGVVLSNCDGDQPGTQMNLFRFVRGIGLRPLLCGNIKGLQDPYRTPATQEQFARRRGQRPNMVTSFADGTKISFEQATVANATGMRVACRGMHGHRVDEGTPVSEAARLYDHEALSRGPGIVDYVVGAAPAPGVFVLASCDDPVQRRKLALYKMGEGPTYCLERPFHLCHFEVPSSVARAVLFHDAVIAPAGPPVVDVVAVAKRDLEAGSILDGIGGFDVYGECENTDMARSQRLLPMGLALGCRLKRSVARDRVLGLDDVELPASGMHLELYRRQDIHFFGSTNLEPTAAEDIHL